MKDSTFYFKGLLAVGPYKGYVVLFCRLFTRFAMIRVAMLGLMVVAPLLIVAGVSADSMGRWQPWPLRKDMVLPKVRNPDAVRTERSGWLV